MLKTLSEEAILLKDHWGTGSYHDMASKINCFAAWADGEYWFSLPDMGAIVATAFNVALVAISILGCFTYLPVKAAVGHDPAQKLGIIAILHLPKEQHWVPVCLL